VSLFATFAFVTKLLLLQETSVNKRAANVIFCKARSVILKLQLTVRVFMQWYIHCFDSSG